jgi:glycosyltransferase involved in cell wall biosynthesis
VATRPKLAIIYQQMSPTRVPVFDALYRVLGETMRVFYPVALEGDRDRRWSVGEARHPYQLLRPRSFSYSLFSMTRYVHCNLDILPALRRFDPDCVAIWNFHPTALLAWGFARFRGRRLIVATDGCLRSDRYNTPLHRWVRRLVVPSADAVVGTSVGSRDLFLHYGASAEQYFNCWLCADNERFAPFRHHKREFDVAFSGQFIDRKLPHFFVDVVREMQKRKPDVSALLIGDGPLAGEVRGRLTALGVRFAMPGFLGRDELPQAYASARLLLFPTKLDAYGVVANEALAVGTPVIANDEAGAVGEVILDGRTGYVLPLEATEWAAAAVRLLEDVELYRTMSDAGFRHIQRYTYEDAAEGLRRAFAHAIHAGRQTAQQDVFETHESASEVRE